MENKKNKTTELSHPGNTAKPPFKAFSLDPRPATLGFGWLWLVASGLFWLWSGLLSGTNEAKSEFSLNVFILILLAPCCTLGAGLLSRIRPRLSGACLISAALASTLWFLLVLRRGLYLQALYELGLVPLYFMIAPMLSLGIALLFTPPKSPFQKKGAIIGVVVAGFCVISIFLIASDSWRSLMGRLGIRW